MLLFVKKLELCLFHERLNLDELLVVLIKSALLSNMGFPFPFSGFRCQGYNLQKEAEKELPENKRTPTGNTNLKFTTLSTSRHNFANMLNVLAGAY